MGAESVVKALTCCSDTRYKCDECDYQRDCHRDPEGVSIRMLKDALRLVKEKTETVLPKGKSVRNVTVWSCGACGGWVGRTYSYCPWCGRRIEWGETE